VAKEPEPKVEEAPKVEAPAPKPKPKPKPKRSASKEAEYKAAQAAAKALKEATRLVWTEWAIAEIERLNHDCIVLKMKSTAIEVTAKQAFTQEIWHVDLMKETQGEEPCLRSYTPVSDAAAYTAGNLDIMFKVYPDGKMTSWIAKLDVGDKIPVSNPHPTADLKDYSNGAVFVAGGSAVTVGIQFCLGVLNKYPTAPVNLIMCNRHFPDVLYKDVFDKMCTDFPAFTITHCLSGGKAPSALGKATWLKGRITKEVIEATAYKQAGKLAGSGPIGLLKVASDIWKSTSGLPEATVNLLDAEPLEWAGKKPAPGNCRQCLDTGKTALQVFCLCKVGEGLAAALAAEQREIQAAELAAKKAELEKMVKDTEIMVTLAENEKSLLKEDNVQKNTCCVFAFWTN
jgi:NAD(P)H-flavin reductase